MTKPMSEDHRQLLQGYIDESFTRFKEVIQSGRPRFKQDPEALNKLATGEIFSATRAKQHGLIDEIGFLEEALARAAALARLDVTKARVVQYRRPAALFDLGVLASASAGDERLGNPDTWLDLATPRAYYLAAKLPPVSRPDTSLLAQ